MNDSQMLEKLAMTDAYAPHEPLPASAWTRDTALAEIERRTDMQTEKRTAPQQRLGGRRNGWLVAAGAAIAVFVLIGGSLWFVSGTRTDVVEEPMVTMTSPVPTTVAPVPVLPVPSMVDAWQRVGGTLMAPVVGTFDMTVVGSRLFVVGFDWGEDNSRPNGVIFASDDGVNWVRLAEDDPALTSGGRAHVRRHRRRPGSGGSRRRMRERDRGAVHRTPHCVDIGRWHVVDAHPRGPGHLRGRDDSDEWHGRSR